MEFANSVIGLSVLTTSLSFGYGTFCSFIPKVEPPSWFILSRIIGPALTGGEIGDSLSASTTID